jgi:hypothetical protein
VRPPQRNHRQVVLHCRHGLHIRPRKAANATAHGVVAKVRWRDAEPIARRACAHTATRSTSHGATHRVPTLRPAHLRQCCRTTAGCRPHA